MKVLQLDGSLQNALRESANALKQQVEKQYSNWVITMGKASKVKAEVVEVRDLVDLIQVLKDVADMKYHALAAQRIKFNRFNESFTEFFSLVGFSQVQHPLVE